jgi:hypothetical protein
MTITKAIDILEKHNEWRRFKGNTVDSPPMQDPKLIGEAIDIAIYELLMLEVIET